jgi:tight adherence protein C
MNTPMMFAGILAAAGGVALVANAGRNPAVDAGAVLAELEGDGPVADEFTERLRQPVMNRLVRPIGQLFASRVGNLLPSKRVEQMRHKLLVAGVSSVVGPEEFLVLQALGGGVGLLVGLGIGRFNGQQGFGLVRLAVILMVMGVFLPVGWLSRKRDDRQASISRDLPDVLDLLAISVEAGVGFEGAVEVVTRHFQTPLAAEFGRTLREMELGLSRRDALQNLKRRTEVPELSNFVLILVQADALGMPISRVLRTQAVEMRSKRRQWAREKAGKLPVKMLMPLTLFILPALFVVILGPAAMSITKNL